MTRKAPPAGEHSKHFYESNAAKDVRKHSSDLLSDQGLKQKSELDLNQKS